MAIQVKLTQHQCATSQSNLMPASIGGEVVEYKKSRSGPAQLKGVLFIVQRQWPVLEGETRRRVRQAGRDGWNMNQKSVVWTALDCRKCLRLFRIVRKEVNFPGLVGRKGTTIRHT
jgi:hypothetical protein